MRVRMPRLILKAVVVFAVLNFGGPAMADQVTLDAEALRKLAFTAVKAGFAEDALRYTDALLQRDPADSSALVIRSQALRALGRDGPAKKAAHAAWDSADSDPARFGAAMVMAQALSTGGRRTAAQWWLRRAAQNAPNDKAEALARRDFGYVKSRNPWDVQINVSAAPSSNVNNGSRQDTLTLAGLPFEFVIEPEAQALSGFETGFGVTGTYRFSPKGPLRQTTARFGLLGEAVVLSNGSKAVAPNLSGRDFSFAALEAGVQHKRALDSAGKTAVRFGAAGGRNWYGGALLSDYLRVETGLDRRLGPKSVLSFGATVDRVVRIDSPVQSSDRLEAEAGLGRKIANGDRLSVGLMAARAVSASAEIRNEAVGVTFGWAKAEPVAGIGLQASLRIESRVYEESAYVIGGREDMRLSANLSMSFEQVDYLGFSPVLQMQATRNRSNAALYDTQDFGITFGIKSSF
jgi:hypothetical protein